MCAHIDPRVTRPPLQTDAALRLIAQAQGAGQARQKKRATSFSDLTSAVVEQLGATRCLLFLNTVATPAFDPSDNLVLTLAAQSSLRDLDPIKVQTYDFSSDRQAVKLFAGASYLLLQSSDWQADGNIVRRLPGFLSECKNESILVFPLLLHGKVSGCLTVHFLNCPEVEVYTEIGRALAGQIVVELENAFREGRMPESSEPARRDEEIVQTLSRRLNLERWARKLISRMHGSLDRDVLLQQVVDGIGTGFKVSRCLVVRTDGTPPKVVTHEYAEAEISPLGLGRTGQVPPGLIDYFREDVCAFGQLSDLGQLPGVSANDLKSLKESHIRAIAGAPITAHGKNFGVIVLLQCDAPKQWTSEELEMLVLIAEQTAVALGHCETLAQMKDQLFHMTLMGNLTQQLTTTLELVAKNLRTTSGDEKAPQAVYSAPLSFRELEVLKLIASGYANREIAKRLFLTESTVELHASRIRKKLNLKSRTALVKYACDNALV
jgi:DNA-binding CsgD family transcriptional regulator